MESKRPGGFALSLPLELWQRILTFLSTKEWAKASGTCRAFRGIQLDVIDLDVKSHNALGWAGKQWHACSKLSLNLKAGFDCAYLPPEVAALGDLAVLRVFHSGVLGNSEAFPMWLGSLLSNCRALQALVLSSVQALPFLPPLLHLRHLVLTLVDFGHSLLSSLGMLHGLVSLSLEACRGQYLRCPHFDLTSLFQLKDFRIEQITPDGFGRTVLPEACAVHLVITRPQAIGNALGYGARIASIEFTDSDEEVWEWPVPLLTHCTSLQWTCRCLGSYKYPLSLSGVKFSCLRELGLKSRATIDLLIPVYVHLSVLHVCAQRVVIMCEDANAAVAKLDEFCIASVLMLHRGVLQMKTALERRGKVVVKTEHLLWDHDDRESNLCNKLHGIYLEGGLECSSGLGSCSCNACCECVCSGY